MSSGMMLDARAGDGASSGGGVSAGRKWDSESVVVGKDASSSGGGARVERTVDSEFVGVRRDAASSAGRRRICELFQAVGWRVPSW